MVVIAFVVPLALLIQTVARDRAIGAAETEARSLAPVIAAVHDETTLDSVIQSTADTNTGSLTVFMPDGRIIGSQARADADVVLARSGKSFTATIPGGVAVLVPVLIADTGIAVIRVSVPDSRLRQGVPQAWLTLALTALALVVVAVVVADRIATGVVAPTRALADAARSLAGGALETRLNPTGPPEVEEVGRAFNILAERIGLLLAAEREAAADLSHRLRTPLAALRLDIERPVDDSWRDRLATDVQAMERGVDAVIRDLRRHSREGVRPESDVVAVTLERVEFWSALAEDQGRPLRLTAPREPRPVALHPDELVALVDALLENVFAHTAETCAVDVRVEAAHEGRSRLVVEDEGPGLSSQVIARGFSSRSTGLGLDIVRRTAEAASGTLTLVNRAAGGTRVEVELGPPAGSEIV
jgi:signal transduction histidine kinase